MALRGGPGPSACHIERLPDTLLIEVFQNLLDSQFCAACDRKRSRRADDFPYRFARVTDEKQPLATIAQVCKRFRTLADDESLWEDVSLDVRSEDALSLFTSSSQTRRTEWMRMLKIIVHQRGEGWEVESASWFDDSVVELLHQRCPNLEHLSVCFFETDLFSQKGRGFRKLEFRLPELKHLDISGAQKLESIYLACPKLETLRVTGVCKLRSIKLRENTELQLRLVDLTSTFIKDATLQRFLEKVGERLTSLSLGVSALILNEDYVFRSMMEENFLKEEDFAPITAATFLLVARYVPKLENLSLYGNKIVPLAFYLHHLTPLAKGCVGLRKLTIEDDTNSSEVFTGGLGHNERDWRAYWAATGGAKFSSLASFRMDGGSSTAYVMRTLPPMCPNLLDVVVRFAPDQRYNVLFDHGKPKISEDPLALALKKHCPLLKGLCITRYRLVGTASATSDELHSLEERDEKRWQQQLNRRCR